jgi:hypothetical protein
MFTPALDLIIDATDRRAFGLLALDGTRVVPASLRAKPRLIRNDGGQARVRLCTRNLSGNRQYDDIDLSGVTVRMAISDPDQVPATGTFPLGPVAPQTSGSLIVGKRYMIRAFVSGDSFANVGASANATGNVFVATGTTPTTWTHSSSVQELTSDIAVDASYSDVQTALNATAGITALGGVTVTKLKACVYRVTFSGAFGAQAAIEGPVNAGMSPLSFVNVSRVQAGTATLHEVQIIRLVANPYCFATLATPLPVAAAAVTAIQPATSDFGAIKRLSINPLAYEGIIRFTLDGKKCQWPFNASAIQAQSVVGPQYDIVHSADQTWDFYAKDPAQDIALTVDSVAGLLVPVGVSGRISLNTVGLFERFAGTTADTITLTLEVEVQFPGEDPQTVYNGPVEDARDVIVQGDLAPATMAAIQFVASNVAATPYVFTNAITALRGGSFSLESLATTGFVAGTRYDIIIGGNLESWIFTAGAANVGDPTGQVQPLDNANFHWAKGAGY